MVKKIGLPTDAALRSDPMFEVADRFGPAAIGRKAHQCVGVIRHQDEQPRIPPVVLVTKCDRIANEIRHLRQCELLESARLGVQSEEPNFSGRIDPLRRFVWERATAGHGMMEATCGRRE
jgi:hypothetical protein